MTIKMDSGEQFTVHPGDSFHIPPGHDAWTEGNEACVMIDVTGVKDYAKARDKALASGKRYPIRAICPAVRVVG
jgi:quercetin dioxygenase-like cupin family protein